MGVGGPSPPPPPPACEGNTGSVLKMNIGGSALPTFGYIAENTELINGPKGLTYTSLASVMVPPGMNNADVFKTERWTKGPSLTYKIQVPAAGIYRVQTMHSGINHNIFRSARTLV